MNLSQLGQNPLYDPISQVVYTDSSRATEYVWVEGKALLEKGQLSEASGLDEERLIANAVQWQKKISQN